MPSSLGQNQCQESDSTNCADNLCQTLINNLYKDEGNKYNFSFFFFFLFPGHDFTYLYTDDSQFLHEHKG